MLNAPVIKSLMQEDDVLGDGATDVNLFDGDVPGSAGPTLPGSGLFTADTLADGTYSFTWCGIVGERCVSAGAISIDAAVESSLLSTWRRCHGCRWRHRRDRWCERAIGNFRWHDRHARSSMTRCLHGPGLGLTGSDALDLADVSYGANTTATFLGNTNGGTLTVTDGTHTANIALEGNYLSSGWTCPAMGMEAPSSLIRRPPTIGKPSKLALAAG